MIFFLVTSRDDIPAVKKPGEDASTVSPAGGNVDLAKSTLLAWNEVYEDLNALKEAVMTTAAKDPVCQGYCAVAEQQFGLNPLKADGVKGGMSAEQHAKIIGSVFRTWPHPMIGNAWNSPNMRRRDIKLQFEFNYQNIKPKEKSKDSWIDEKTLKAIEALYEMLGPLTLKSGARDQMRVCNNIVELARAMIGAMTCDVSKRLEKLTALRLCQSETLLARQRNLLRSITLDNSKTFADLVRRGEYLSYYLNLSNFFKDPAVLTAELTNLAGNFDMRNTLLEMAVNDINPLEHRIGGKLSEKSGAKALILHLWSELPPTIRCAVLINDIRKLNSGGGDLKKNGLLFKHSAKFDTIKIAEPCIVDKTSGTSYAPKIIRKGPKDNSLMWSWNRDEQFLGTVTYRHHLCPLWGGSSGHTGGGIGFWQNNSSPNPADQPYLATTVALSLFMLWRIYYDKRISAVHTMTETLEATLSSSMLDYDYVFEPRKLVPPRDLLEKDILNCLDPILIKNTGKVNPKKKPKKKQAAPMHSLNPLDVLNAMRHLFYLTDETTPNHATLYDNLGARLEKERSAISAQYWLPRWSKELEFAKRAKEPIRVARHGMNTVTQFKVTLGATVIAGGMGDIDLRFGANKTEEKSATK